MTKVLVKDSTGTRAWPSDEATVRRCLAFIAPDPHHELSCRGRVEHTLNMFAPGKFDWLLDDAEKVHDANLREIAYALSQAADVMTVCHGSHLLENNSTDPWSA